jgi:hypothetical protein
MFWMPTGKNWPTTMEPTAPADAAMLMPFARM